MNFDYFHEIPLGPRNCIGLRMGKMQAKVGVAVMLKKYSYELSTKHHDINGEFTLYPPSIVLPPVGGRDKRP